MMTCLLLLGPLQHAYRLPQVTPHSEPTHTHSLAHTHTHTPRLERVRGGAAHRRCRPGKVGHAAGEPEALGGRVCFSKETAFGAQNFLRLRRAYRGFALGTVLAGPEWATLDVTIIPVSVAVGVETPGVRFTRRETQSVARRSSRAEQPYGCM